MPGDVPGRIGTHASCGFPSSCLILHSSSVSKISDLPCLLPPPPKPLSFSPAHSLFLSRSPLPCSLFSQCGPDTMQSGSCSPRVSSKSPEKLRGNGHCVLSLILDWPYCGPAGFQRHKSGVLHCSKLQMKKSFLLQKTGCGSVSGERLFGREVKGALVNY